MSAGRDVILGKIRRSLGVNGNDGTRRAEVALRLAGTPRSVIPARGQLPPEERLALHEDGREGLGQRGTGRGPGCGPGRGCRLSSGTISPPNSAWEIIRCFAAMPWSSTRSRSAWRLEDGKDAVGLSHALAGVAETGTLVLASTPS